MKNVISSISLILLFLIAPLSLKATHIAGGELTYVCNGFNDYTVYLVMYRNCNGAATLGGMTLKSYNHFTGVETTHSLVQPELEIISDTFDDPCATYPSGICMEKGTYVFEDVEPGFSTYGEITFFAQSNALSDVAFINNVLDPQSFGITYKATVPMGITNTCQSSPMFNADPPAVVCIGIPFEIDVSCTPSVPENTLVYEFFTPYDGQSGTGTPDTWDDTTGDFDTIVWETGYNAEYSFGVPSSTPPILTTVLSDDGIITVNLPNSMFLYNGVKVTEYDEDGDFVSEINRMYTYIFSDCNLNIAAINVIGQNQGQQDCGELTVNFENTSTNSNTFVWNFGDESSTENESSLEFPLHTYSEFGTYNVSLISYTDDIACSDTTVIEVELIEPIEGSILPNEAQCLTANSFDFGLDINYAQYTVNWNFGPNANQGNSSSSNPTGIVFNTAGTHTIYANISAENCEVQLSTNIVVFDGLLDEIAGPNHACDPETVTFHGSDNNPNYEYTWTINGETLTGGSVEYYFDEPGFYDISLYVYNPSNGCESTQDLSDYIEVFPTPMANFEISDQAFTIGEQFQITDKSQNTESVSYSILTDGFFSELKNPFYIFNTPGVHQIVQTAKNGECIDTHEVTIDVSPRKPIIPNVFTPNEDGINDVFYINTHNNENVQVEVFDRWGQKVYSSDNYEQCNPNTGEYCWNGYNTFKNKKCKKGHYFYIVQLATGESYKGTINLF